MFMRNFVPKKIFIFEFNGFRIETKLMRNFVQKDETVVQENLMFRGNPSYDHTN